MLAMLLCVNYLCAASASEEPNTQPVYVFHITRGNKEELLHGRILEEGARHYKILLDYPWQEGNKTRTVLKSDLTSSPVIELRSERDERIKKGWWDYFDSRGEVNIGTIDNPKAVPKQALELAVRARDMVTKSREAQSNAFPRVSVAVEPLEADPNPPARLRDGPLTRPRIFAAGIVLLVSLVVVGLLAKPIFFPTKQKPAT